MPYSTDEPDKLPDYVQELDKDKQAQWVAVWNSAYDSCEKDKGEDCEASAFAQANGVVLGDEERITAFQRLTRQVTDFIRSALGFKKQERAGVNMSQVWEQVWAEFDRMYSDGQPFAYIIDLYFENSQVYVLASKEGKIYRIPLTINETDVTLGEWLEVAIEYKPVEQTRTTILRTADGKHRWFSIANSAVLNRVGEIDSRACIDSFVQYAQESGEYPYRTFYHKGEKFRIGQCDWLARDGNFLLTSGVYDDSPIASAEITARQAEPDYWGESIGYDPLGEPVLWEAAPGVNIPVYDTGILREISTAPERECAALYTNKTRLTEVNRMLDEKEKKALVHLFGDDEAAANDWLSGVEGAERTIAETGQITRTDEGAQPEAPVQPVVETPAERVMEIDDDALEVIADRVFDDARFTALEDAVASLSTKIDELTRSITADNIRSAERMTALVNRLDNIERSDDEKHADWVADLPERPGVRVTYRPRVNSTEGAAKPSYADVANATLANLNKS